MPLPSPCWTIIWINFLRNNWEISEKLPEPATIDIGVLPHFHKACKKVKVKLLYPWIIITVLLTTLDGFCANLFHFVFMHLAHFPCHVICYASSQKLKANVQKSIWSLLCLKTIVLPNWILYNLHHNLCSISMQNQVQFKGFSSVSNFPETSQLLKQRDQYTLIEQLDQFQSQRSPRDKFKTIS